MNIIKHGNDSYPREFTCHGCECKFEADRSEYTLTDDPWGDDVIKCNCPECGKECWSYNIPPKPTYTKE